MVATRARRCDEFTDLLSDVATLLSSVLAQRVEISASIGSERLTVAKLKDAAKRKKELEKQRKDNELQSARSAANEGKSASRCIQLLNGQGRLIGWIHSEPNGKVTVYDAKGRLGAYHLLMPKRLRPDMG
jgi:hypothetical protein